MLLARIAIDIVVAEQTLEGETFTHLPAYLQLKPAQRIVNQPIPIIVRVDDRGRDVPVALVRQRGKRGQ